jgi:hypothetical protein
MGILVFGRQSRKRHNFDIGMVPVLSALWLIAQLSAVVSAITVREPCRPVERVLLPIATPGIQPFSQI